MGSEDNRGLTVVGCPFSTFTRTITLALQEKGVAFEQVKTAFPQTPEALAEHPFGRVPAIRHGNFQLIESQAIANYLDVAFAEAGPALRPPRSDARASARVDEMASFAASYVFPAVEHGVVKPRLKMQQEGVREADIAAKLVAGVDALRPVLAAAQERGFARVGEPTLLSAEQPTWADLYLLPPLADLVAVPEGSILQGASYLMDDAVLPTRPWAVTRAHSRMVLRRAARSSKFPQLSGWLEAWRKRPSFRATEEGTLLHDSKL